MTFHGKLGTTYGRNPHCIVPLFPWNVTNVSFYLYLVPSVPPSGIKIHAMSSRSIFVSWNAIPQLYRNGALEGYLVKFTDIELGEGHEVKVKDNLDVTLKNLKTYTKYKICVEGYTKAGPGVSSGCYEKWTFEDGKKYVGLHTGLLYPSSDFI